MQIVFDLGAVKMLAFLIQREASAYSVELWRLAEKANTSINGCQFGRYFRPSESDWARLEILGP